MSSPFNIFACLVHESFECVVDLLQNLRYFDPQSLILLYNGGEDRRLLDSSFPFERYNAVIHPSSKSMQWGRLHEFVFDCIKFAVDHSLFQTLTFVDSDQLLVRGGYSYFLANFLHNKPNVGLLGNSKSCLKDSQIFPVRAALQETELWTPFLRRFPGGTEKFVYWTFWPSTIITYRAARDIYTSFSSDAQLLEILTQTKIVATEEIVFPTLAALLGYEIGESPCSYQYVRWGVHITPIEVDAARHMLNAYWVHTVPRHYDNPTRKYMREKFNGYQPYLNSNLLNKSTYPPRVNLLPSDLSTIHQAKGVEGWIEDEEAELLIATACRTRQTARDEAATIVEIGSYCGKSTIVLGLALKAHKIRASIYAIDPFDGVVGACDQGRRQVGTTFETFIKNIHSWGLTEIVKPIKNHSFKIHWDKPIDLLFIDALHDYPNVTKDFFHFAEWVRPGGLVALHDYATDYPGVHTLVNELLAGGKYHLLEQAKSLVVLEKVSSGKSYRFEAPEEQCVKTVARQEQSDENHLRKLLMHGKRPVEYPEASIIIPVHNEGEKLYLTLEALRYSTNVNYEVIVVDDGSTDSCCNFLRSNHSLFNNVLLVSQNRMGVATARNVGAAHARSPVVLFLDAHCFPQGGWLEKLLTTLYKVDTGIIAPCISVAGNTDVKGFGLTIIHRDFSVRWLGKQADEPYEVPLVGGGCMTMKKSFFEAIGGFDTMRTFGVEDVELCIRCWLFGYPVIVVPNAEVAHWFKEKSNFYVGWQDYVYNLLRTAILHFDGESLARILDHLRTKPSFREAIESLLFSNIWETYSFFRSKRKHNAEWFYQRFAIEI